MSPPQSILSFTSAWAVMWKMSANVKQPLRVKKMLVIQHRQHRHREHA
jgi:hypothetical protein